MSQSIHIKAMISVATIEPSDEYGALPMIQQAVVTSAGWLLEESAKSGEPTEVQFEYEGILHKLGYNYEVLGEEGHDPASGHAKEAKGNKAKLKAKQDRSMY